MRIRRVGLVMALGTLFLGGSAYPQSLAEIAKREKKRRKETTGSAKVFTNQDLGKDRPSGAAASATPATAGRDEATAIAARRDADRAAWSSRASKARAAIKTAEALVADYQSKIDGLREPQSQPTQMDPLRQDPNNLLTYDEQRQEHEENLAAAEKLLTKRRKELADLKEEARRESIPPGWLRER